ncbi:hypothetical protein [Nocardia brasiliensis]|uniref:hypothetical protein n=1 Tax=Nocardia brasiliensis TaxID=37326 RepID=UPI003D8B9819
MSRMADAATARSVMPPRSELAHVLETLPEGKRRVLGIGTFTLSILDVLVATAHAVTDADDPRPVAERFDWLEEVLTGVDPDEELDELTARLTAMPEQEVQRWVRRIVDGNWKLFVRRLVGAAAYDRLERAYHRDVSVVVALLRWVAEHIQPYAVAFDDCMAFAPKDRVEQVVGFGDDGPNSLLGMVLALDGALARLIKVDLDPTALTARQLHTAGDLAQIVEDLRALVSAPTRAMLDELSDALGRKLRGACDALEFSADGVCQAANSLVELIDRLLRTAFTADEVLAWVHASSRPVKELRYRKTETSQWLPTKRAEALCFVYGGRQPDQVSPFHELVAEALVQVRGNLQGLKHSDTGDPSEFTQMRKMMFCVEAFITLGIRVGWIAMEADRLGQIRARFAA